MATVMLSELQKYVMVFESKPEAYLSSFLNYRYVILFEPITINHLSQNQAEYIETPTCSSMLI